MYFTSAVSLLELNLHLKCLLVNKYTTLKINSWQQCPKIYHNRKYTAAIARQCCNNVSRHSVKDTRTCSHLAPDSGSWNDTESLSISMKKGSGWEISVIKIYWLSTRECNRHFILRQSLFPCKFRSTTADEILECSSAHSQS